MIELKPEEYNRVHPLIQNIRHKAVYAYSVIEQIQPGRVFVDCADNPTSCFIASIGGKYIVAGEENHSAFNRALVHFLSNQDHHKIYFDLYASSEDWIHHLHQQLQENTVILSHTSFQFNESRFREYQMMQQKNSHPHHVQLVDEGLFKLFQRHNPIYQYCWGSKEAFLQHGLGYCIIDDDLVCMCISGFVGNNMAEMDIYTHEPYRKQGLAQSVCSAFIEHCLERNIVPNWGCDSGNEASIQLATKLGFEKTHEVSMLWWHEDKQVVSDYLKTFSYT